MLYCIMNGILKIYPHTVYDDDGTISIITLRVWGVSCGLPGAYGSWREMFLHRPHPRYNGCYIARTTYFRPGETSYQDQNYHPWHVVQYYRYFR